MRRLTQIHLIMGLLIGGCATAPVATDFPQKLLEEDRGRIIQVTNGEMFTPRAALETLAKSTVIYVGERHDSKGHHEVQALITEGLISLGYRPVLGFEMLGKGDQESLDKFVSGELAEDAFLEAVQWRAKWGFSYSMYRPLLQMARKHKLRAIALNAPRELVSAVGKTGRDGLPDRLKAECPPLNSGTKEHRAYIRGFFHGHHGHGGAMGNFDNFYAAQLVWDETMAEGVKNAIPGLDQDERLVIFAGKAHVEYAHGIPSRASADGTDFTIVLPVEKGNVKKYADRLRVMSYPAKVGDWIWEASTPEKAKKKFHHQ